MIRKAVLALSALALLAPALAHAGDAKDRGVSEKVYVFSRNVGIPDFELEVGMPIVGAGYRLNLPIKGSKWDYSASFEYGVGSMKNEFTNSSSSGTNKTTATHYAVLVGMDYLSDCCDDDGFYCGPGLYYSSTTLKFESTGDPSLKYDPLTTIGLEAHMGGAIPLGPKVRLFGENSNIIGMDSWKPSSSATSHSKITAWATYMSWKGGLRVKW
jgi:hypothetical protein